MNLFFEVRPNVRDREGAKQDILELLHDVLLLLQRAFLQVVLPAQLIKDEFAGVKEGQVVRAGC